MSIIVSKCIVCKNYIAGKTCLAFLDGIPADIFEGLKEHTSVVKGQNENHVFTKVE